MKNLVFIVPALNEEESIAQVVGDLRASYPSAIVLVVNDGSTDRTSVIARGQGATVVDLPYNLGIGSAVQTGFMFARREGASVAIQFDGDRQHIVGEIDKLLEPLREDLADVVIGSRFIEDRGYRGALGRRIGISIFSWVNSILTRQRITDCTSGFRAFNRGAIEFLSTEYPHDYAEPESIISLAREGFRIMEVPVDMRARQGGRSSITLARSVYYAFKVMIALLIGATRKSGGGERS